MPKASRMECRRRSRGLSGVRTRNGHMPSPPPSALMLTLAFNLSWYEDTMRQRLLTFSALALAMSAPAVWAQRGPGGPGRMGGPNPACRQGTDSLSDAQKAQVKTAGDAFMTAHK